MNETKVYSKKLSELTFMEKQVILQEYPPIGSGTDQWIKWVLDSKRRGLCPYR